MNETPKKSEFSIVPFLAVLFIAFMALGTLPKFQVGDCIQLKTREFPETPPICKIIKYDGNKYTYECSGKTLEEDKETLQDVFVFVRCK